MVIRMPHWSPPLLRSFRAGKEKGAGTPPRVSLARFRVRLVALAIVVFLPLLGLTLWSAEEQRSGAEDATKQEALRLARLFVSDHNQSVESARQLLTALAQLAEVRGSDPNECNALFSSLLRQYTRYANLGVAERDGSVFCSAETYPQGTLLNDRLWFQGVVTRNDFAGGEFQIGRASGRPTVNFAYPVRDPQGQVVRIVFASLDLSWLNRTVEKVQLPEGGTFLVVDYTGTVLVRYPDAEEWFGRTVGDSPLVQAILLRSGEGGLEAEDIDGERRLHAFVPLSDLPGTENLYFANVGIPLAVAFREANETLRRNLVGIALITFVTIIASWFGGNVLVVRQVRALQQLDRLKSEFVSLASHPLRTPLTAMRWIFDLIQSGQTGPLTEDQKDFLAEGKAASERVLLLVQELLNLSRIEAGRIRVNPEPTDLVALSRSALVEIAPQAKEKEITLIHDFAEDLPPVSIDSLLVRQIIGNF